MRALTLLLALVVLLAAPAARAAPLFAVQGPLDGVVPSVEWHEDPSGGSGLDEVRASAAFRLNPALNIGYSRSAHWLRFTLRNPTDTPVDPTLELYRNLDHVDVWVLHAAWLDHRVGGNALPFGARELPEASLFFRLHLAPREQVELYVRASGADTMELTPRLWTAEPLAAHLARETLASGLYYGAILAIALYNFFLFLSTRERAYALYVLAQISYLGTLAALDRATLKWLWPNHPGWAARSEIVFGALSIVFGAAFGRAFLDLPKTAPLLSRLLLGWTVVGAALATAGLFTSHSLLQQGTLVVVAVGMPTLLLSAGVGWARGNPNAKYFFVGYSLLVGASVVDMLQSSGVLARPPVNTLYLRLGAGSEALLLAFGLAARIRRTEHEKATALEQLSEGRRQHAETLEAKVDERTRALAAALEDLERSQRELARKERLAALGRLVSGVAHEVDNPLNFAVGGATEVRAALAKLGANETVDRARRALGLVEAGNERIRALVDNLRAYVRRERPASVRTELEKELDESLASVPMPGVEVTRTGPPLPAVSAPAGEIAQVFTNVLLNAVHAMPEGGALTIETVVDDERARVSFTDTGPGVPDELRERIFEPFFTTRAPGEGTGLGLAVAHEILRACGGDITVEPSERGARFVVLMPRARETSTCSPGARPA